jgi:hypothetical protein
MLPATPRRRSPPTCCGATALQVAITDAMDMQGVAGQFGVEDAAVRALLAGYDLPLTASIDKRVRRARRCWRRCNWAGCRGRLGKWRRASIVARLAAAACRHPASRGRDTGSEAQHYRQLCRQALRVPDPAGWKALSQAARERGKLALTGWPADLVQRLASRLPARGLEAVLHDPEAADFEAGTPLVVVLGERRPLSPERIALFAGGPARGAHWSCEPADAGDDAPLVESFTSILRSADTSDAMLDVVADRLVDAPGMA